MNKAHYVKWLFLVYGSCFISAYAVEIIVDPTQPPKESARKESVESVTLKLTAIKINKKKGKNAAIINERVVKEKEWFADAQVVRIDANQVELRGPKGNRIILKLITEPIAKITNSSRSSSVYPDIKTNLKESIFLEENK